MELRYENRLSTADYLMLRQAVGWEALCSAQAEQGLKGSSCVFACYDGEAAVGTARLIWDGGYIAYIADVMIRPEYQGRGIGRHLVQQLISFVRDRMKPGWKVKLVLIAALGKEGFYEKLGFIARPNAQGGPGMEKWLR